MNSNPICPNCRYEGSYEGSHDFWCRENIPLRTRVKAYLKTMIAIGWNPERAVSFLSDEDRAAISQGRI